MSHDIEHKAGEAAPATAAETDERRRETLRKLGRAAVYAVPTTLALMSVRRAAAVSIPG
ncbi:hypothetical protein [Ancylobacter sp. IITR112]|uniref:hypothetical protein n=1 Tax=Ancylobacter sp. IITR112 TaxID=3138073 RepID=UPI00352A7E14